MGHLLLDWCFFPPLEFISREKVRLLFLNSKLKKKKKKKGVEKKWGASKSYLL
jgi:hypothetical protein